ncbi:MAG: hypothetical protein GVY22_02965 [Gammaproteobacteria bacterium]|nr:hypothetical protein [Gammaproteobacteria bacterium]
MGLFERYLTLWVALCILAGIGLGHFAADAFQTIGALEVAQINLPVAVLIWLMIIPMLLKVDLTALSGVTQHWRGSLVTLVVNWAIKPFSMALLAWLATLVLLFGFQGEQIIQQPLIIGLLAVPLLIQSVLIFIIAYLANRWLRSPHCIAGPSSMIGTSNFFELAVATAIALFGFESGAALATVVGVLIEVPVMLLLVRVVLRTQAWYERGL